MVAREAQRPAARRREGHDLGHVVRLAAPVGLVSDGVGVGPDAHRKLLLAGGKRHGRWQRDGDGGTGGRVDAGGHPLAAAAERLQVGLLRVARVDLYMCQGFERHGSTRVDACRNVDNGCMERGQRSRSGVKQGKRSNIRGGSSEQLPACQLPGVAGLTCTVTGVGSGVRVMSSPGNLLLQGAGVMSSGGSSLLARAMYAACKRQDELCEPLRRLKPIVDKRMSIGMGV